MRPITTFPVSSGRQSIHHTISQPAATGTASVTNSQPELLLPLLSDVNKSYRSLLKFDGDDSKSYYLAETKPGSKHAHQIVMIKKVQPRPCYRLQSSSPRILLVIDVFQSDGAMFLVLERPGVLLSRVVLVPALDYGHVVTILREVRKC